MRSVVKSGEACFQPVLAAGRRLTRYSGHGPRIDVSISHPTLLNQQAGNFNYTGKIELPTVMHELAVCLTIHARKKWTAKRGLLWLIGLSFISVVSTTMLRACDSHAEHNETSTNWFVR